MRKFSQLSYHERDKIYTGLCQQKSKRAIAKMIDRPPSAVTREIIRNSDQYGYFYPGYAHEATQNRKNKNAPKIDRNPALKAYIIKQFSSRWSPEMIAAQWSIDHKDETLCKETIYDWLYSSNEREKIDLRKLLIRKHKKRGLKAQKNKSKIKNRVSIHDRPDHINTRSEVGHYECDLIFNDGSQSQNICTLIERITRKAFLIFNKNKLAKTVMDSLIKRINDEGLIVKSITFDNGTEFADHTRLNSLKIDTYFCDPGTPSQKGAIENFNGMLRRFVPSELAAADITEEYVAKINDITNLMPRKILLYKTPLEVFNDAFESLKLEESRVKSAMPAAEAIHDNQKTLGVAFRT
jgi:IS30 family transposase